MVMVGLLAMRLWRAGVVAVPEAFVSATAAG